ncbi:hypothetical protein LSH36_475g01000 [Paralvinella palmiformis]|uniref:Uncharacterized protein n=1 Tax=Paralvinella palmiformis TaxID=53620 RepID=A0AAD9J9Y2_9ANNE|nr:hypothetical protein LSH36_475g01000 [Paralvinella palmiformis]
MFPKEDALCHHKEAASRLEPSAPPLSDLDVDNANMNELNKSSGSPKRRPDILMNIPSHGDGEKCRDKLIPAKNKLTTEPQGPWKTKNLGELVNDEADPLKIKRKRQRKVKKALGWAFWITCAPLAVILNLIRDSPIDPDDPFDWNNDPLRPWNYKVNLDAKIT